MCLEVTAIPRDPGKVSARRLAEASGLHVRKVGRHEALRFSFEPGCSCSLLADEADIEGETWLLRADALDGLARALELLAREAHGFTFSATWIGENSQSEELVRLSEVLADVRANRIKNRHNYRVGGAG